MNGNAASHLFPFGERIVLPPGAACLPPADRYSDEDANYQRNLRTVELATKLAQQLSGTTSVQVLADIVTDFLLTAFSPERTLVVFFGEDRTILSPYRLTGFDSRAINSHDVLPISQNVLAFVCNQFQSILTSDAQEDSLLRSFASIDAHSIRSLLCVPIGTSRDALQGVVYMDSRSKKGVFTHDDLLQLNLLCQLVTLAFADITGTPCRKVDAKEHGVVGDDPELRKAVRMTELFAKERQAILFLGETGTGKELFAKMVHEFSPRAAAPYMVVQVSALTPTLIESELFGHEKGAFTGAVAQRKGKLEQASGGTIFLDEVADIPLELQTKLLRVLEGSPFQRVGGQEDIAADVRVVAATHRDLEQMVEGGTFRRDLLGRLGDVVIRLPPLRQRKGDIPALVEHFLARHETGARFAVSDGAMAMLKSMDWPLNVRDLMAMVGRMAVLAANDPDMANNLIREEHVRNALTLGLELSLPEFDMRSLLYDADGELRTLADVAERVRRAHVLEAMAISRNQAEAARRLDCSKAWLSTYLKSAQDD